MAKATKKQAPKKQAPKAPRKQSTAKRAPSPMSDDSENISIRRISNGWVLRESHVKNGKYIENETFTPTKPTVSIPTK